MPRLANAMFSEDSDGRNRPRLAPSTQVQLQAYQCCATVDRKGSRAPNRHMRNNGLWTEARFRSFVKSALRSASNRWGPKYAAKRSARSARNSYLCSSCSSLVPNKEAKVDHIVPVVDPVRGFVSWDEFIARLFVEQSGYQVLCQACHAVKTGQEREVRKANRKTL